MDISFLTNAQPEAIQQIYEKYKSDPSSVDREWELFFTGFEFNFSDRPNGQSSGGLAPSTLEDTDFLKELGVFKIIDEYRKRGHLFSKTNPIRERRQYKPEITIERFGLNEEDLDKVFRSAALMGLEPTPLREIITRLEKTYCSTVGCEYQYLRNPEMLSWLSNRFESNSNIPNYNTEQRKVIYKSLNDAVLFEKFMHTRFVGQKRFSLEGCETIIPALETTVEYGASLGVREFVIGMAHRGRLNVLANIMKKPFERIFSEFEGKGYSDDLFGGDVKYHMGFSHDRETASGNKVHLSLLPNPSHLEAVNPVVVGMSKAKIEQRYAGELNRLIPIVIHGDAAIAGQGINYELLQMSSLNGYGVGGTVHIILNNQIGFTTSFLEARSSTYCTDLAKICKCPTLHVNGDDVEMVVHAIQFAVDFRQTFHTDVFIDILGYRRFGHNEADDPNFSHPLLYQIIGKHPNVLEIYKKRLISLNVMSEAETSTTENIFIDQLDVALSESRKKVSETVNSFGEGTWKGINRVVRNDEIFASIKTGLKKEDFYRIAEKITSLPSSVKFMPKIEKIYDARNKIIFEQGSSDWAMGEQMALASLLDEQYHVRFSGEDVCRGTFSHRHAYLHTDAAESPGAYIPLENIAQEQGKFSIFNSLLSEYAVLGFEFGYSLALPKTITIWEAQFGDFANGGQTIIDQFIASSESKWQRFSGLVMLLPHGYEGQGPEHSCARIERYLQMCAEENIQVMNITTPANYFHALRRQMHRDFRKPLIIFTPKSLLRDPLCVSPVEDYLEDTTFKEVIDDELTDKSKVKRLIFCSGKVYYDLLRGLKEYPAHGNIALVRLEQLYPIDFKSIKKIIDSYPKKTELLWVQEEPENFGPAQFMHYQFLKRGINLRIISRKASAATATGFIKIHQKEQTSLIKSALGPNE